MRWCPEKIVKNNSIGYRLNSPVTQTQPITGGNAPAAPPITIL